MMSYVNIMIHVCTLYELYGLCKSYKYFYELLKITGFYFKTFGIFLIYKDGKTKLQKQKH